MEKRGQITTFIIIGLVLVVAVLLFFFVRKLVSEPSGEPGIPDATAVKRFTETCMKDIVKRGAEDLMVGAGYLDYEKVFPDTIFKRDATLKIPNKIPLWYYKGEDRMPTLWDMESQLEHYLETELPSCLDNYSSFDAFLDVEQSGTLDSKIYINREDISIAVDLSLTVRDKLDQKEESLSGFAETVKTRLGKLYALASILQRSENQNAFLEFITDDVIANGEDFPYEGMDFTCAPKRWTKLSLKEKLKERLPLNLALINFENTQPKTTGIAYYDKLYRFTVTPEDFTDVAVDIIYNPDWDMTFDVHPSKGNMVYPIEIETPTDNPVSFLLTSLSGMCMKLYHHKYTVEYPVLFKVADVESGETFFFATPVLMKNNQENRKGAVRDLDFQTDIEGSKRYCAKTEVVTDYAVDPVTNKMIFNEGVELPKELYTISVYARDVQNKQYLADVPITYRCMNFLCDNLGNTSWPLRDGLVTGADPVLKGDFPGCVGALFSADKEGYYAGRHQETVDKDTAGTALTIPMYPLKSFSYGFKPLQPNGVSRELLDGEEVMVTIENQETGYRNTIYYPSDYEEFSELALLWGEYNYTTQIILFKDDTVIGGGEFVWKPKPEQIETRDYVLFYPVLRNDLASLDPEGPEWKAFQKTAEDNPPALI